MSVKQVRTGGSELDSQILDRIDNSASKPWIVICDVSQQSDADVQTIQETMRELARNGEIKISPDGNVHRVCE